MTEILVDTDILSYFFKGDKKVFKNFEKYLNEHFLINIGIITYYEISSGLMFKEASKQILNFKQFLTNCTILPITQKSADISAQRKAFWGNKSKPNPRKRGN